MKPEVPAELQQAFAELADKKAMEPVKKEVQKVLAQKRRLYDELERRKLLKLA